MMAATTLDRVAAETDGLSFAHLEEIVRLSGLTAIHAGRAERAEEDLVAAMSTVRGAYEAAVRGFPTKPEVPFGLAPRRR